jgi:hypothetical protein
VDSSPSPRFLLKAEFFTSPDPCDFRHFGFKFLIAFADFGKYTQAILNSPRQSFLFGHRHTQFVLVLLPHLGGALREFRIEARPRRLVLTVVFTLKQSECFLGGKLGYASEVFRSEAVENLCAGEFARAVAQGAFNGLGRCGSRRHVSSS